MSSSQLTPLSALHAELQQLCIEVRTDSLTTRNKAVERLNILLSNRKTDIANCLSNPNHARNLSWTTLFNSTFEGLVNHSMKMEDSKHLKSFTTMKNKSYYFTCIITKILEYAVEVGTPIKCSVLIEQVANGFQNCIVLEYFSTLLFQIIEIGLVVAQGHLPGVKVADLNNLLKKILNSFQEDGNEQIPLLKCVNKVIELGTNNLLLCIELPQYLPTIETICSVPTDDKNLQNEIVKLMHSFVCNVIVESHMATALFLQKVMPLICGYYDFRMKSRIKEQFFELCTISLYSHYLDSDNFTTVVPIDSEEAWKRQLKQFFGIVQNEVTGKSKELNKDIACTFSKHFLMFASLNCYLIYWNPLFEIPLTEGQAKIVKHSTKYEKLMDLAICGNNQLNWGWFTILSDFIAKYSHLIDITDYQPLLQMVARFLQNATVSNQVKSVANCVHILLQKQDQFKGDAFLSIDFCHNQWKEIIDTSINNLLQKTLHSENNQILVRSLLSHEIIPNDSVMLLLKSLISNSALRSDSCLTTVKIAIKHYRYLLLAHVDIVTDLINWIYPFTTRMDAKSMLNYKPIDPELKACLVTDLISENFTSVEERPLKFTEEFSVEFEVIRTTLDYNVLRKLVYIESRTAERDSRIIQTNQTKLITNADLFKILLKAIDVDPQTVKRQDVSDLLFNMSSLEILQALVNCLRRHGSFDKNDLCISALLKKVGFLLDTVELQLGELEPKSMHSTAIKDVLDKMNSMLEKLCLSTSFELFNNRSLEAESKFLIRCLNWYSNEDMMLEEVYDISFRREFCLKCLKLLSLCNLSAEKFLSVDNFKIKITEESEVLALLDIIEAYSKRSKQSYIAEWILTNLENICTEHHNYSTISIRVIEILPKLAEYLKSIPAHTKSILIILSSFLRKCYNKNNSPNFIRKVLKTLRSVARVHYESIQTEDFVKVFLAINKFLLIPSKLVQYAAVECWSYLIDEGWLFKDADLIPFHHVNLCRELFESIDFIALSEKDSNIEHFNWKNSVMTQLLLSALGLNFYLEENAIINLNKFRLLENTDNEVLEQIEEFSGRKMEPILKNNLIAVVNEWLMWIERSTGDSCMKPWMPFVKNEIEFIQKNRSVFYCCAVYLNYEFAKKLSFEMKSDLKEDLQMAQSLCTAIALPYLCDKLTKTRTYGCDPKLLISNMEKYNISINLKNFPICKLWEVIYFLICNVWNGNRFTELFGFTMTWPKTNITECDDCIQSIEFLLTTQFGESTSTLGGLLKTNAIQAVYLLSAIKTDLEESYCLEMKLFVFFHYCLVLDMMIESFDREFNKDKLSKVKQFLIRDSVYYLCNMINDSEENSLSVQASLHYLGKFCGSVVESHAESIAPYLNVLSRTLIAMIVKNSSDRISELSLNILNLLLIDNCKKLAASIAILDDFPLDQRFEKLRQSHEKYKYANRCHSLVNEIEYFLQAENRGIVGFQNLRKCLATEKAELNILCNFTYHNQERVRKNSVFKLLKLLLETIKNREDVAIEAAKCLGELGPINLTTIALFSDLNETCYMQLSSAEDSFEYFVQKIIDAIDPILLTEKHTKINLAKEIAHQIICSKIGKKCLSSNPLFQIFKDAVEKKLNFYRPVSDISLLSILKTSEQMQYTDWVRVFTSKIYASLKSETIQNLAIVDVGFCERTFVAFFKMLLATNSENHIMAIQKLVNHFFKETFDRLEATMDAKSTSSTKVYTDKSTIKYFLNIAECIRVHNQNLAIVKLNVNYLHIAKACEYCEAFFMAVLYLEIWALAEEERKEAENKSVAKKIKEESKPINDEHFQSIAMEAYTSIGYLDAISGFLDPMKSRLNYLALQNKWDCLLLELDAGLTQDNSLAYASYLRQKGFYSLAGSINSKNVDYETLWRLGNWNIINDGCRISDVKTQKDLEENFQRYHYLALKSLKRVENEAVAFSVDCARNAVVDILKIVSSECAQNIYKYITWLQMLQQIDDFNELQFPKGSQKYDVLQKWENVSKMDYGKFDFKEMALSQKIVLFEIAGIRAKRRIQDYYKEENVVGLYLWDLIQECKAGGNTNLTIRNIAKLKLMSIPVDLKLKTLMEDANVNWKLGNTKIAQSILYHIGKSDEFTFCLNKVDALRTCGEYYAESNSESFVIINKKFFKTSLRLLESFEANKNKIAKDHPKILKQIETHSTECRKNIYKSIAKYSDREYSQLNTYMKSEDFRLKVKIMGKHKDEADAIQKTGSLRDNRDDMITFRLLLNASKIDDDEIQKVVQGRIEYLCLAIENYMQFSILDDSVESVEIFRIISLWFANKHTEEVLALIKKYIEQIPTYKFIGVLNQVTARLNNSESEFDRLVIDLLEKCSEDHPHHTLPHILAIAHANLDGKFTKQSGSQMSKNPRVAAAEKIVNKLLEDSSISDILHQMQKVSEALIELANIDAKQLNKKCISDNVRRLKNLSKVQCLTLDLPVSPSKNYEIISIAKWRENITLVGGINVPKKIACVCSDGIERSQLLKGRDDLRQDAIMQQVFKIVNNMLTANKDTQERRFILRTYKVVPLSMRSGILDWCENTLPLGLYLSGPKKNAGAHKRYRPQDYAPDKCMQMLMENHKSPAEERLQIYKQICANFKPVFHHFFFERFLNPENWFEKRLAYTNSVATTSMVGYILGLGDRHVYNILIDEITAEVIHIDFGIAFEQGRSQYTPETIPFRLTRDIVAPFGVCKVDGIFRESCERTMKVLRENQSVLLTVLEVLLYDPLYAWIKKGSVENSSVDHVSSEEREAANSTAQRALIRVKAKLLGMEETTAGITSIEGQVQRLIREATDSHKLCLLFPGWGPHI